MFLFVLFPLRPTTTRTGTTAQKKITREEANSKIRETDVAFFVVLSVCLSLSFSLALKKVRLPSYLSIYFGWSWLPRIRNGKRGRDAIPPKIESARSVLCIFVAAHSSSALTLFWVGKERDVEHVQYEVERIMLWFGMERKKGEKK